MNIILRQRFHEMFYLVITRGCKKIMFTTTFYLSKLISKNVRLKSVDKRHVN